MANPEIKIIIADDSPQFVEGLQILFSTSPKYKILEVYKNGRDLVQSNILYTADLLLVDIDMPEMNGIDAADKINFKYPQTPMIAITMHQDKIYLLDIIRVGFKAFIYKPDVAIKLLEVIDKVLNQQFIFPENLKIQ